MTTLTGDSVGTLKRRWWAVYPDPTKRDMGVKLLRGGVAGLSLREGRR